MEPKLLPASFEEIANFSIQATESIAERWPRTLKHGDTFALFDQKGDIVDPRLTPGGIFHEDMRHLSGLELRIQGQPPLLLSSTIEDDNVVFRADLANPDVYRDGQVVLPRETIHVRRSKFLWQGRYYERIAVHNFDTVKRRCFLTLRVDADFADLFEIRGLKRARHGEIAIEREGRKALTFRYIGLDERVRRTRIVFDPPPQELEHQTALFDLELEPHAQASLFVTIDCNLRDAAEPFSLPYRAARRAVRSALSGCGRIDGKNVFVDEIFHRANADLRMLCTATPYGPYPYAGTPWFNTAFGRDGIVTALLMLWLDPGLARGVLQYLAATQAHSIDAANDAEPGKILHETRHSEMALLKEVPFGRYYGGIDATPLFVVLAHQYHLRTGDTETIRRLWPNIRAALDWIENYGDRDGDGFVEYFRESPNGLVNQGWKDSSDSISHSDGALAAGPIALCEVQSYVYSAFRGGARLARLLDDERYAAILEEKAERLRVRFEEAFWCEEIGTYALALDGDKRRCEVISSNAGQVLLSGIAASDRALRVANTLVSPQCFSGWGIRTLATSAVRYNPMSYHNGSVWPHDNAIIALGFGRYGLRRHAGLVFKGMFDAASHMDLMRFPELFCGFSRRRATAPTLYPVACTPQAWASVAPFALLQACLGIECDSVRNEVVLDHPALPAFVEGLEIRHVPLGYHSVDIRLSLGPKGIAVARRRGDANINVIR